MARQVEFVYDLGSRYSYLASTQIGAPCAAALAAAHPEIDWRGWTGMRNDLACHG